MLSYLFTGLESVKFFYVTEAIYLKVLWPKHDATKFNIMVVASMYCELDQTLFARGAYTESDNAPARKIGSGYARLDLKLVNPFHNRLASKRERL